MISCKVILILKSFCALILLILFIEIYKISKYVHVDDVQRNCCSNVDFFHFS